MSEHYIRNYTGIPLDFTMEKNVLNTGYDYDKEMTLQSIDAYQCIKYDEYIANGTIVAQKSEHYLKS